MARIAGAGPQRVTRSQSRELDDPIHDSHAKWNDASGRAAGKAARLSMVAETSPQNSSHRQKSLSGHRTSVVPGSPESQVNISGTTFLPQEDTDPEDGELEPILMVDELPGLQEASDRLLNLLKTNAPDPRQVVDAAKKLANPRNTENKRLKPAIRKLISQMKPFGSQRFIDVEAVQGIIPTVQLKGAQRPWSMSPALQRANCARLATDVLLASIGSQSPDETIRALETQFPAPFLSEIVQGNNKPLPVGGSVASGPIFEMALEIRTQFAIAELQRRENEKGFDARSVLESVFYGDGNSPDNAALRGFNPVGALSDEYGRLPDQFQDKVSDRFSELDYSLSDDDGNPNIKVLKSSYWSRFLVCTARFIQRRDKELREITESQPPFDDVREGVEKMIQGEKIQDEQELSDQEHSGVASAADRSSPPAVNPDDEEHEPDNEDSRGSELFVSWSPSPVRDQPPQQPIQQSSPASQTKQPTPSSAPRRHSSRYQDLSRNLDFLQRRREARKREESSRLSGGNTTHVSNGTDVDFPSPNRLIRNPHGVTIPTEVAQTPESELRYPLHDNDDTLINDGDELDLGNSRTHELMQSTSPPGSERTRQVSYNHGLFFASPARARFRVNDEATQRRTLLDQQENRTRVNWSSEDESQLTERLQSQGNPTRQETGKRRRDEEEEESDNSDDDSDDAFEQTEPARGMPLSQARRLIQQSRKRQRTTTDEESSAADQLHGDLMASGMARQHRTQSASEQQPASQEEPSNTSRARLEVIAPPSSQSRWSQANDPVLHEAHLPNMRRRWTADENERLITLVGRYGTRWAEIKAQDDICPRSDGGPKLQGRTQVNLKDRARNIKKAHEKQGKPLPMNFEFIKTQ
ncbi:hypothetical protein PENSTE_c002G05210 [Penicillium steckii]|uniref:Uncharacterized protein n=1 Tax=Penicillium steckii TaxID=303698 RepID=A0A1V6TVX9_9EURO|nr:hypothetical protein PENSTE_c002G05210 [Penicillium steckii]